MHIYIIHNFDFLGTIIYANFQAENPQDSVQLEHSGSHPPSPADSGVSDVEQSSLSFHSDEDTKPNPAHIKSK